MASSGAREPFKKKEEKKEKHPKNAACYTATNEMMATESVYHYTHEIGLQNIVESGHLKPSRASDASFGPGVYGTGKGPRMHTKEEILTNNYGRPWPGTENKADCTVELKVPRRGPEATKKVKVEGQPGRDIQIVSEEKHHLNGQERHGTYEQMRENALSNYAKDALVETTGAMVAGAMIGAAVGSLYAGADYANGKITLEEAGQEIGKASKAGAVVGGLGKGADVACRAVANGLAKAGAPAAVTGSLRNTVPVLGAAVGVASAGKAIWDACQNHAGEEEKKEAVASSLEAAGGVAATVAVVALEASGPVGWAILGGTMLIGFGIRKLL